MQLVNDEQLSELAREPVRELFPAARRDSVMQPLVILLAILPGLLVFWNPSLGETTSHQGLMALDVGRGDSLWSWLTAASREPSEGSSHARPLAALLVALGLKLNLLAPESRLLLASYASSAFLLLCLASLAKQCGGSRLGLLVVLLACGHRDFLTLSGGLPPASLPLAFAVLSFRGLLVHQTSDAVWVSWSLIGSGLSLAACWLSGGELAIGAWCVVGVQSLLGGRVFGMRTALKPVVGQWLSRLAAALVGFVIATTIGVGVVFGWQLAFSEDITIFDALWTSSLPRIWTTNSGGGLAAQALLETSGAWLGFVLLGVMRLARPQPAAVDATTVRGRWFLISWLAIAGFCWWTTWITPLGEFTNTVAWSGFLLLSLLFLAAWGLEAVLLRKIGIGSVVIVVLVTCGVFSTRAWGARISNDFSRQWLVMGALIAIAVAWIGVWLHRRVSKSDSCRRIALTLCVSLMIFADMLQGIRSLPRLADDERELLAFRRQLLQEAAPRTCWLVTEDATPARLRFFLQSLWRDAEFREAKAGELDLAESHQTGLTGAFTVVVTWGSPQLPTEEWRRRGHVLTQAAAPHYFQGRPIKGYRWSLRSTPSRTR